MLVSMVLLLERADARIVDKVVASAGTGACVEVTVTGGRVFRDRINVEAAGSAVSGATRLGASGLGLVDTAALLIAAAFALGLFSIGRSLFSFGSAADCSRVLGPVGTVTAATSLIAVAALEPRLVPIGRYL